ncbi:Ubiquitin-conjugating enzyme family protein [Trichomonas vaginalis G3]|uniref:Ubiquitin-conjugating enzyme family protein n=1 Tax=Trichomonas vaginalis (strain ATCC PRA-98 / G3) TaxID=412133 RepID=A2E0M6_TRIV3|nr:ubiquitin conjugating enzyme protein [Trichomonas vaginalis G3]EAY13771.1 Ubiquitin-conjugating enzyme family protein [Trichomonas vaginalis G3]KAI5542712.1 ubiquitin conjugating enzyme protein [Trichomonas vaginalis G3]|eukprot:XP_001325994.1 Ubiquitin-conjugating enzyme family protein [Trichomonas vaginalis G3]
MTEEEEVIYVEYEEEDSSSSSVELDFGPTTVSVGPRVVSDEEIQKMAMNQLKKDYQVNMNSATDDRIVRDYYTISRRKPSELGFSVKPYMNDIRTWEVHLFGFDKKDPIYADIQKYKKQTGKDYIELRVSFPPDYPNRPPFLRVISPRCVSHGGRVTLGGAICVSALTLTNQNGWSPIYDFESLFMNIIAEMLNCEPPLRIDFNNDTPYSTREAIDSFMRLTSDHGWKAPQFNWQPK